MGKIGAVERIDAAQHWIAANAREVWAALIDPEARQQWLAPEDATAAIDDWAFTLGGGYRLVIAREAEGASEAEAGQGITTTDVVDASFTRLAANSYIEETVRFVTDDPAFADPMRLQWQLTADGTGTLVQVSAFDVPPAIDAHDHLAGLGSLSQLATTVEHRAA